MADVWTFKEKQQFTEGTLWIYEEGSFCKGIDGKFISIDKCKPAFGTLEFLFDTQTGEIQITPPPEPEPNIKLTAYFKIKRTNRKTRYGEPYNEPSNWVDAEASATVIIKDSDKGRMSTILEELWDLCDNVLSKAWNNDWMWMGINPNNVIADQYETENTEDSDTYPTASYEWVMNTPSQAYSGKGVSRI